MYAGIWSYCVLVSESEVTDLEISICVPKPCAVCKKLGIIRGNGRRTVELGQLKSNQLRAHVVVVVVVVYGTHL